MPTIPEKRLAQGKLHEVKAAINNSIDYQTVEEVKFDGTVLLHWTLIEIQGAIEGLEIIFLDDDTDLITLKGEQFRVVLSTDV